MSDEKNAPRVMPLKQRPKLKRRKNRVTVEQIIVSCCQPLSSVSVPGKPFDQTKAIDEFMSMKFDYERAAQVHMTVQVLQKYIDAAIKAFNETPPDKQQKVLKSSMVLHFQPFHLEGLFISGNISARSLSLLGGWLVDVPKVDVGEITLDPPLEEGEERDDEEEIEMPEGMTMVPVLDK